MRLEPAERVRDALCEASTGPLQDVRRGGTGDGAGSSPAPRSERSTSGLRILRPRNGLEGNADGLSSGAQRAPPAAGIERRSAAGHAPVKAAKEASTDSGAANAPATSAEQRAWPPAPGGSP